MTQAPAFESDQELLKLAQGLRDAFGAPAPVALSRRTVVGFRGKAKLYYYPPKDGGRFKTPLVLFPYLGISRPYIFDLRPGESFAEFLYEQGIPFYLCDWGIFGPEDRDMGMDDVIGDMIPSLIRQAVRQAGLSYEDVCRYLHWDEERIRRGIKRLLRQGVRLNALNVLKKDQKLYWAACRLHESWGNALKALTLIHI